MSQPTVYEPDEECHPMTARRRAAVVAAILLAAWAFTRWAEAYGATLARDGSGFAVAAGTSGAMWWWSGVSVATVATVAAVTRQRRWSALAVPQLVGVVGFLTAPTAITVRFAVTLVTLAAVATVLYAFARSTGPTRRPGRRRDG